MAEEKKKGFFQRLKSAFLGEQEEQNLPETTVPSTEESKMQETPETSIENTQETILFEKSSDTENTDLSKEPELNVKLQIGKGEITSEINPKTGILFEKASINEVLPPEEKAISKEVVKKRATSELMLDLASQESPLKSIDLEGENVNLVSDKEQINKFDSPNNEISVLHEMNENLLDAIDDKPIETKLPEVDTTEIKKERSFNLKSLDITDISNKKKVEEVTSEVIEEEKAKTEPEEENKEPEKKGWFSKVVDTLNSPIEIKLDTSGDDSIMGKLKGNISIGLGKPVVRETDEERELWRQKLRERLSGTRQAFTEKLERLMHGRTKIDEDLLEEIEEILLESDVGVEMTDKICAKLRELAKEKRFLPSEVMPSLFDYLKNELSMEEERIIIDEDKLNIILMVGVNGTGKTTTTGKIAAKLSISEYSVILAAADTFRAAAIEQLEVWSHRADVPLIKHQENSDAAAVVYDAIKAAKARKANVLLIDTAGRLHNKAHLMDELKKIRRIIDNEAPDAKLEVLLVLDATTGQNGLSQALIFKEAVNLTGVVLTKLDGTAKGGVIFAIKNTLNLPIKLVGVGESLDDLRDFQPQIFIDALFSEKSENLIEESTKIRS